MENAQPNPGRRVPRRMLIGIVPHRVAVFMAIRLVHLRVGTGRMTSADTGLTCGLLLAPACAIAGGALSEEYVWFLVLLALLAGVGLWFGAQMTEQKRGGTTAGA